MATLEGVWDTRVFRIGTTAVSLIGGYDLLQSQFLSPEIAARLPRLSDLLGVGIPTWIWFVGFFLFVAIGAIQYAHQHAYAPAPWPPVLDVIDVFLDHGLRLTNSGPPATFRGTLRIVGSNSRIIGDKEASLWWENSQSIETRLPTGGEDRARLVQQPHVRGYGFFGYTIGGAQYFGLNPLSEDGPFWAEIEITIAADPAFSGAPLKQRFHYDEHGLRPSKDAAENRLPYQIVPLVDFDVRLLGDEGVVLSVTNRGKIDEFQAQVIGWAQGELPTSEAPVSLKWVNGEGRFMRIAPGATEHLRLAKIEQDLIGSFDVELVRNDRGEPRRGGVAVCADWVHEGVLGFFSYWKPEDFQTKIWTLEFALSSASSNGPIHQGARLHLFGRISDDPTGKLPRVGGHLSAPTLRGSLVDLRALRRGGEPEQSHDSHPEGHT